MRGFILKRLFRGLITIFVAITITFIALRVMPGDPTTMMMDARMSEEARSRLLVDFGLDKSLFTQYLLFLKQLIFHFDLGQSFVQRVPVLEIILSRLPWTLLLMCLAILVTSLVGIPLGVIAAYYKGSLLDQVINFFSILGIAIFIPWFGIVLLYFFGLKIPIFPIGGAVTVGVSGGIEYFKSVFMHLVLPVISLATVHLASYVLFMRANMVEVLNEDYIRTARAKGIKEKFVLWKHAAKNAMLSTITMMGLQIGAIVGGAILTETIFAYPGLGRLIFQAVQEHDYPILQGTFIILAFTVVIVNVLTDILYQFLDPKIKFD